MSVVPGRPAGGVDGPLSSAQHWLRFGGILREGEGSLSFAPQRQFKVPRGEDGRRKAARGQEVRSSGGGGGGATAAAAADGRSGRDDRGTHFVAVGFITAEVIRRMRKIRRGGWHGKNTQ